MKHYYNNSIHKTGDTIIDGGIKYVNCTDAWYKKHGAIEVVEVQEDGVSGLYTIDEDCNAVEPYTDQVITHTETYTDDEGKEQTYEWTEPVAHKYFEYVGKPIGRTIEEARIQKISEIEAYDTSDAVNGFTYQGQTMWIDVDLRVKIQNGLNKCIELGEETYPLWNGNVCYHIPCEQLNVMLAQLEVYAIKCMDNTNRHKANIIALTSIADVDAYDFTGGYPDKLAF